MNKLVDYDVQFAKTKESGKEILYVEEYKRVEKRNMYRSWFEYHFVR